MSFNKTELREKYKIIREAEKSELKDKIICRRLFDSTAFKTADTVFVYCSSRTEVSTYEIIETALSQNKKVALPKCTDSMGSMDFYIVSDLKNSLIKGMYSIMEPDSKKCKKATESDASICIVPGLAFDNSGYRLGYGKGYYDRFLSRFKGISIGLSYDACLCDKLPFDKYDRKVDMIITENETLSFK